MLFAILQYLMRDNHAHARKYHRLKAQAVAYGNEE